MILTSCNYEDVEVENVQRVEIEKLDKSGIEFTATLQVRNPNSYRVKVTSTDADIYVDGRKAGKAELRKTIVIPAEFNDVIEAPVRADFEKEGLSLIPILMGAALKREVHLRAEGTLTAKSFIISKKFDFEYEHDASF